MELSAVANNLLSVGILAAFFYIIYISIKSNRIGGFSKFEKLKMLLGGKK